MLSPTEAWSNLVNATKGNHTGFTFTAPAGTVSLENQAEWILERPAIKGTSAQLPNSGEIYFDSAMVNDTTVAATTVETPTLIKIPYTGS